MGVKCFGYESVLWEDPWKLDNCILSKGHYWCLRLKDHLKLFLFHEIGSRISSRVNGTRR